ncbi:MAG: thiamine pyrophosphate-dependent dehydrogenase E1 component subunit alpha [Polyangiales bacterium]
MSTKLEAPNGKNGMHANPSALVSYEPYRVIRDDLTIDPARDPKLSDDKLVELYSMMVKTRVIDERLVVLQRQGRIGFHIGSLGEEATILGSAAACRGQDWIFPCYREFGALLMRGMPLQTYVDNMFGNANDAVKGRQMPDHYSGKPYKFGSVSSPIGTQITQAVGFEWAAKMKKDDLVTLVYFGEGATSSNEFHNGVNFAGVFKTPTVFICRNNGWAISVPASKQSASQTFADKAIGYGIRGVRVDGNDLLAVYAVTRDAIERGARGEGPTLIECLTYRLSGHSTSDDPKAYRKEQEVEGWKSKDPNVRFKAFLEKRGLWNDKKQTELEEQASAELAECVKAAEKAPTPSLESMFDDVYAELPWHLREQREELLAGPRAKGHGGH